MPETEVTQPGAQPSGAPDKGQGGKGADEKVTLTRAEFESMRRERDEARESERFWASKARSGGRQEQVVAEPEEQIETADLVPEVTGDEGVDKAIFDDPDKWAEAVSKGPGAIKAYIKTLGLVTGAEVADIAAKVAKRTVDVERAKMGSDAAIVREFPDLQNQGSDLFKATSAELKKMVAMDPNAARSPATLYAAATAAKAKLDAKRPIPIRRGDSEDDDRYDRVDDEREDDRRRRADAQDGTRRSSRDMDEDTDMLGPEAREVIRQMGITNEEFAASAKEVRGTRARSRR